ncbi:hypothetical protein C1M56_13055 [Vibrio diazotrophicus]|nr:hypothetical protein C1M56_13055 [Vibrio diazotrophicus]
MPYFVTYHQKKQTTTHPPAHYALAIMDYFRDLHRHEWSTKITKRCFVVSNLNFKSINYLSLI